MQVMINGQRMCLGVCDTPEDAAHMFDRAAITTAGCDATLNYPLALYAAEVSQLIGQI